jgi:predicted  nucleic acid-binding Zn-ribbon protein
MLHGVPHWKATIHTYSLKKFQKLQQLHALTVAPKRAKSCFGCHSLLGIKPRSSIEKMK